LRDEMLTWVAAPGFPPEGLRLLKPFRVLRDTAGLLDASQTLLWTMLSAGQRNQRAGVALQSALGEPATFDGARLLVRTRTFPEDLGLRVDASQAARVVQRIEESFAAERAQL